MNQFSHQQGVGLIEVMVAVLLLSVAVLGFSALQMRAISATEESLVRTQALSVVRGLSENMRANTVALDTYESTVNDPSTSTVTSKSCSDMSDANICTSKQVAAKEAKAAVEQLNKHDISISIKNCPSNANTSDFSKIKCVIASWGDTLPTMAATANACANEDGIYNNGSTCIIVEAY